MSSHASIIGGIKELKEMLDKLMRGNQHGSFHCELDHLKEHILQIEDMLNDPMSGLEEIKREIKAIECKLEDLVTCKDRPAKDCTEDADTHDCVHGLTTGPVIRCDGVKNLYVEVLNNLDEPQTVRILLFDLRQCSKQLIDHRVVPLNGNYTVSESFDIGPKGLDLTKFEVQLEFLCGSSKGIYVFVAGTTEGKYTLVSSNVFRHEQLSPLE